MESARKGLKTHKVMSPFLLLLVKHIFKEKSTFINGIRFEGKNTKSR